MKDVANPFVKLLSINDMIAHNTEIPAFLLSPEIDKDKKIALHCDSEEHLDEIEIKNEKNIPNEYIKKYTDKKYISHLKWRYADNRAEKLLQYIKEQLNYVNEIELRDWMDEKVNKPNIKELNIQELNVLLIKEAVGKGHYGTPFCLKITN